jgi:hypothetical protein
LKKALLLPTKATNARRMLGMEQATDLAQEDTKQAKRFLVPSKCVQAAKSVILTDTSTDHPMND